MVSESFDWENLTPLAKNAMNFLLTSLTNFPGEEFVSRVKLPGGPRTCTNTSY
jgi:hypothetical protein